MINWYEIIKLSMALPRAEDYPKPHGDKEYGSDENEDSIQYLRYNPWTIESINRVLKKTDIIEKYGPLKYLGSGTEGIAYLTSDGKVIKITFDRTELEAARSIMEYQSLFDGQIPHIVTIYDANQIPETEMHNNRDILYYILSEKVIPLDGEEKKIVQNILSQFFDNQSKAIYYDNKTLNLIKRDMVLKINKNGELLFDINLYSNIFDKIFKMTNYLNKEIGMTMGDLHADNIGKRESGEYVLMDIGHSL